MGPFGRFGTMKLLCVVYLISPMALAAVPWPAEPISQAVNLTGVEGPGANDFYSDLSGAVWNPTTRRLWVCRNGPGGASSKFWVLRESGSTFEIDYRNGNRGEWTGFGDLEGMTVADYSEDTVYLLIEGEERIKEYDVSTYGTAILRNDWNTSPYLPLSGGSGAEGIAFIPDSFLSAQGFVDGTGAPYTSHNGMGGLMFVAHQNGGRVYAFDLNRANGTFSYVGAYRTNYSESCELAFDRSEGLLYIFHGADLNTTQVVRLSSTLIGGERYFDEVVTYASPTAGNLEGIAIVQNDDCTPSGRRFFLTIDGGGADSLFMFNHFPCCVSNPDADGDGVNDCNDDCPGTPGGTPVDAHGCACSQGDADGDGVNDCNDQCPNTPGGQPVNGSGCSCAQLDADRDGVNDCVDACPLSELGLPVDPNGCNCAQLDHDADGVVDCNDLCPGTFAGSEVDATGCACAQKDADADNVNDCVDQCPDSIAGLPVASSGCNCLQLDGDGDGVNNCDDLCPNTPAGALVNEFGCAVAPSDPPAPPTYIPAAISEENPGPVVVRSSGGSSSGNSSPGGASSTVVAGETVSQPTDDHPADEKPLFFPLGGLCGLGAVQGLVLSIAALGLIRRRADRFVLRP